jgi:hypothetical protein
MTPHIPSRQGLPSAPPMVLQTVKDRHVSYELRYNRCGKANCTRCNPLATRNYGQPGHGPYWYLVFTAQRRTYRRYIGKHLDTSKYRDRDGNLDYDLLFGRTQTPPKEPQP